MALPFLVTPSDGPGRCLFLSSHTPNILHEGVPVETHPLFPETPPRCPLRAHWGGEPYRPLHQPSAVLWLYHVRPSLPWCSFIWMSCFAHQSSGGVGSPAGSAATGKRCRSASRRASNRCSSLSRNVTCTLRPLISTYTLTLAGASGSGPAHTAGSRSRVKQPSSSAAAGAAGGGVGWLAGVAWPLLAPSSCASLWL